MRIGIIQFPGSNCERETKLAVKRAEMEPVDFLWNENHDKLSTLDGYVIVGGFSYEDRGRAGVIAAHDPLMQTIKLESEKGKPVLGICNGAQILVESGLVPGIENNKLVMALTDNKRIAKDKVLGTGYYNDWIWIRLSKEYQRNAFTRRLHHNSILKMPVAHAEGRFIMSEALLAEVKTQGLNVFQYCNEAGQLDPHFPTNPNASIDNIAAISNKDGNVLAIMPHPERSIDGDLLFLSMRDYITENKFARLTPLYYYPRQFPLPSYQKSSDAKECIVELIITDNEALTVQNALRQGGLAVTVRKQVHWEVVCDSEAILEEIKQSGVLFNSNKEQEGAIPQSTYSYLVRPKEDIKALEKKQMLKDHFNIQGIKCLRHGVLWHFDVEQATIPAIDTKILTTHIIYNPYAHECYRYQND